MSLVSVQVGSEMMTTIVLDTVDTANYLAVGQQVEVLFKETEVSLGLRKMPDLSIRNQLPVKVKNVEKGQLLSRILLDYHGSEISSIITTRSTENLKIAIGMEVVAFIKTNEIMLGE